MLLVLVVRELMRPQVEHKKPKKNMPILSSHSPRAGVDVDILKVGTGAEAVSGKIVRVHYTAFLTNGKKVDSSYDRSEVYSFTMGRREVIPGWEAGMIGMKQGEIRKFKIAPEHAYGAKGKAEVPPNATMIFEVELIQVI